MQTQLPAQTATTPPPQRPLSRTVASLGDSWLNSPLFPVVSYSSSPATTVAAVDADTRAFDEGGEGEGEGYSGAAALGTTMTGIPSSQYQQQPLFQMQQYVPYSPSYLYQNSSYAPTNWVPGTGGQSASYLLPIYDGGEGGGAGTDYSSISVAPYEGSANYILDSGSSGNIEQSQAMAWKYPSVTPSLFPSSTSPPPPSLSSAQHSAPSTIFNYTTANTFDDSNLMNSLDMYNPFMKMNYGGFSSREAATVEENHYDNDDCDDGGGNTGMTPASAVTWEMTSRDGNTTASDKETIADIRRYFSPQPISMCVE